MSIVDPHRLAELRSLELHRRISDAIAATPDIVGRARERVERLAREGVLDPRIARRWTSLLEGPMATLLERLTTDDEPMRDLRQSTPFTFVIPPRERWRIWRDVLARVERDEAT